MEIHVSTPQLPECYTMFSRTPSMEIHFHSPDSPHSTTSSSCCSHSSSFAVSEDSPAQSPSLEIHFTSKTNAQQHQQDAMQSRTSSSNSSNSSLEDTARTITLPFLSGYESHMFSDDNEPSTAANDIQFSQQVIGKLIDNVTNRRIGWREVEERFDRLALTGHDLAPAVKESDFAYCIGMMETPQFAEELLGALRGRSCERRRITKDELRNYWRRINDPRSSSRMQIFMDMCKNNKDGRITEKGIKEVILLSASANKLYLTHEEAGECARLILEGLELSNPEAIFYNNFSSKGLDTGGYGRDPIPYQHPPSSIEVWARANWRRAWVVMLWLAVCFGLFAWKFVQYRHRSAFQVMGYCLCTAKGAAETLKFNMALVLLPVCRNTVTWLRKNRRISSVVPFNDNINFHKMVAGGIVIGVILHGGTHLACDFPRIAGADHALFMQTIAADFQHRQPSYADIIATTEGATGIGMVILMIIAFTLATRRPRCDPASLPRPIRRFTGFNTFWYTHHLFVIVYVLLIVHSMFLFLTSDVMEKTTWMYIAIPVLLYLGERTVRAIRAELYDARIVKAKTYPGKVLSLKLQKPAGFQYRSGMYIYVQCPQISNFEWHPFSLTSAPDEDHLSLHIRTLGDWSYQIYSLFQEALVSSQCGFPKIFIDGPYGAAAQDHVKYDITVLIGLGIGATPFISILKHIIHGGQWSHQESTDGGEAGVTKGPTKAYFYWVTRDQGSFDWFRDIMKEVSDSNQRQAVIEMHNYLTSVYKDGDTRSTLISAIQALHYMKTGVDIISRTPVRTHFSRPNWFRVFSGLASRHQGETIGVFYCGPQELARELQGLCNTMTSKRSTRFIFHKENY